MGEAKRRANVPKPSPDSGMEILSPDEAVVQLEEAPYNVFFAVSEVLTAFNLTWEQLKQETKAGRLRLGGINRGNNEWSDVSVSGKDLIEWLAKYRTLN